MGQIQFVNDNFYHIYNRGTDGRTTFLENKDYVRFIHDLYEFNDLQAVLNLNYYFPKIYGGRTSIDVKSRDLLVDIIAFCLMPNHFHLVLRQLQDGGISKFLQKLGVGYTMYFNQKYERSGVLFQGRPKAIWIDKDEYLLTVCNYIHLNPVGLIEPNWKEKGIKKIDRVLKFLKKYRWSSYLDYIGVKNFPSVINPEFLKKYYAGSKEFQKDLLLGLIKNLNGIENKLKIKK
jgi:putative transposase